MTDEAYGQQGLITGSQKPPRRAGACVMNRFLQFNFAFPAFRGGRNSGCDPARGSTAGAAQRFRAAVRAAAGVAVALLLGDGYGLARVGKQTDVVLVRGALHRRAP